jgi:hypothetical protein
LPATELALPNWRDYFSADRKVQPVSAEQQAAAPFFAFMTHPITS